MPKLRGVSSVDRDEGGRSYVPRAAGGVWPSERRCRGVKSTGEWG